MPGACAASALPDCLYAPLTEANGFILSPAFRPGYSDWQALVQAVDAGEQAQLAAASRSADATQPRGLVTVPLLPAGAGPGAVSLGAATFALVEDPAAEDVDALCALGASLAASIQHHTKALWEVRTAGAFNFCRRCRSSLWLSPGLLCSWRAGCIVSAHDCRAACTLAGSQLATLPGSCRSRWAS